MKHIKTYGKFTDVDYKVFESSISIHTPYKSHIDFYLNKIDITLKELNDMFIGLLDDYKSYLQIFYVDKNGSIWSRIPNVIGEEHPVIPYLSVSFEPSIEIESTIKNSSGGGVVLSNNIDFLESFTDAIYRLKSMISNEIYWRFSEKSIEVRIYFDKITQSELEE